MLFASAAIVGLSGCGAEPSEQVSGYAAQAMQPQQAASVEQITVKAIDFASDPFLKEACHGLVELPFRRFVSHDFIYDSPLPVRVSGTFYEVRGKDAANAATVYKEIKATIFRDVEIVVEAQQTAPHFSFDKWVAPFAVSDLPFSASRQIRHRRAMGATFPFLDLAGIPFIDPVETKRTDTDGSKFSRNFISVLNFLATRGENIWGQSDSFEEREKARELRLATTATHYERHLPIKDDDLMALKRIPTGEQLSVSGLGQYIVISLGKPARFVAAIDISEDAVGLHACKGDL